MQRAARIGDGFTCMRVSRLTIEGLEKMRGWAAESGRDPAELGFEAPSGYKGGPEQWLAELERWRSAGGTDLTLGLSNVGLKGPAQVFDAMRQYAETLQLRDGIAQVVTASAPV